MATLNDIIVLSSNLRSGGSPSACQYDLTLAGSLRGTYELLSFQSVDNLYTVTTGENDKIYWTEGGVQLVASIAEGNYATQTLMNAAVKAAMDPVSASSFTPTINGDLTVTWAIGAGTFGWAFGLPNKPNEDSANQVLGVAQVNSLGEAASIDGSYVPTLRSGAESILIKLSEDGLQQVRLINGGEFSFFVPLDTSFGEDIDYVKRAAFSQSVKFTNQISILNVSLYDIEGEQLPSNTPEYVLTLRRMF